MSSSDLSWRRVTSSAAWRRRPRGGIGVVNTSMSSRITTWMRTSVAARFWHGFVFGARIHGLRPGYLQIYVGGIPFFYDDGIFYQQTGDDYQEVYPPVGADVQDLPDGAVEIDAGNIAYYYAGGAFYVQQGDGYVIAPTPIGVTVPEVPPGAVEVSYNGGMAYQFNGIYYQPQFVDGVTQYVTFAALTTEWSAIVAGGRQS